MSDTGNSLDPSNQALWVEVDTDRGKRSYAAIDQDNSGRIGNTIHLSFLPPDKRGKPFTMRVSVDQAMSIINALRPHIPEDRRWALPTTTKEQQQ